jgi:hypothetical protein
LALSVAELLCDVRDFIWGSVGRVFGCAEEAHPGNGLCENLDEDFGRADKEARRGKEAGIEVSRFLEFSTKNHMVSSRTFLIW